MDVPGNDILSTVDKKLGFKHKKCNNQIVTHNDFFSKGGDWALEVWTGVIERIISQTIGGVAALLLELKKMWDSYKYAKMGIEYSPADWFENVQDRGNESYHCARCGDKIDAL
jgi:hypothetical protein